MGTLLHGADYNYEQWLDRPDILDQDFEAMRLARCNVMSVGIFSWARYEPLEGHYDFSWMDALLDRLHANGMSAMLATPSGSKPAWMSKAYPEVCQVDVNGIRAHHQGRHNHCRTSPVYREKVAALNTALATRYRNHPALRLWHVSNEYNATRCYCEHCLAAFRAWLKERYKDIETLNARWWTSFWSHSFSDWEEIYPADPSLNAMMLDWARFTSDQTMDFFDCETKPLRAITPEVPITSNFMQPDVGLDYHEFAKRLDVVSWDNYPKWHSGADDIGVACRTAFYHDLFRSAGKKPFLLMESTPSNTNWQGISPLKRPGMHLLSSLQAVAHGADSVQYFQWRQSRGGEEKFHAAVMSHLSTTDTRTFEEVRRVGELLGKLPLGGSMNAPARVAIVYDFPTSWAIDLAQLPRSVDKLYQETVVAHYRSFWSQGIAVDVVSAGEQKLDSYALVVAPMHYMVDEAAAARYSDFVRKGGHIVFTYLSGLTDSSDLCHMGAAPGPLSGLLGLKVEESDAVPDGRKQSLLMTSVRDGIVSYPAKHYADKLRPSTAEIKGVYGEDFIAGTPALTVNRFGKGRAWYIATRTEQEFLDAFYAERCLDAKIAPVLPAKLPPGVCAQSRISDLGAFIFLMNFSNQPVSVDLGEVKYHDIVANQDAEGSINLDGLGLAVLTES